MDSNLRGRHAPRLITAVLAALVLTVGLTGAQASPAATTSSQSGSTATASERGTVLESAYGKARSRVHGTFGRNGVVRGEFEPRRFKTRNGNLLAVGVLTATLTRANGTVVGTAVKRVVLPVRLAEGAPIGARQNACDILNLVLGPLDLNLLGLEVHLSRVVLDIIAVPGPGNLLGNLLCAIAGLLDNTGVLTQIRQILNAILAILRI